MPGSTTTSVPATPLIVGPEGFNVIHELLERIDCNRPEIGLDLATFPTRFAGFFWHRKSITLSLERQPLSEWHYSK
jgi:hypothetical protein